MLKLSCPASWKLNSLHLLPQGKGERMGFILMTFFHLIFLPKKHLNGYTGKREKVFAEVL
jgi:hypothetical protein